MSRIKKEVATHLSMTSKYIFNRFAQAEVPKTTRCRILKTVVKHLKLITTPPLEEVHKQSRLQLAKDYMKIDFSTVFFTDECRATFDGPDRWCKGWVATGGKRLLD